MNLKSIDMQEQKRIELDILDNISMFCKKNNIHFFLTGGSLLGAVRHQGMIPWDDDIDIAMLRPDYDKFIEQYNEKSNDKYKLIWFGNLAGYYIPFAKVIDTRTVLKEYSSDLMDNAEYGIFVDIFPLDVCPDSLFLTKMLWKFELLQSKIILSKKLLNLSSQKWYMYLFKYTTFFITPLFILKTKNKIAKMYTKKTKPKYVACLVHMGYGLGEIHNFNWYCGEKFLTFEGKLLPVPSNYHAILEKLYGDYMTPPPIEKRYAPHTSSAYWKEHTLLKDTINTIYE